MSCTIPLCYEGIVLVDYKIDRYSVRAWSSRPVFGFPPGKSPVAEIQLFQGDALRARAYFHADEPPPPSRRVSREREILMHFHADYLHPLLELLRSEQPLYLHYVSPRDAYLSTGLEPVGEAEQPVAEHPVLVALPYVSTSDIAEVTGVYCQSGDCPWDPPNRLHDGIDFAPSGDRILFQAACAGVVRRIDKFQNSVPPFNWQVNVDIEYDSTYGVGYAFEPMSPHSSAGDAQAANIAVSVDAEVAPGDPIGHLVQATPEAHVHFGFFRNHEQVCPEPYLAADTRQALLDLIRRDHPHWKICH
jgi:hypothetical protein